MAIFFNLEKINEKELLSFSKGMYYLLKGKISIVDSLSIISINHRKNFKKKIIKTKKDIEKGVKLNKAFSKITNDKEFLEMIRIGEEIGEIEKIFKNLYENYEFRQKIKKEIKSLSIYPISVIVTAFTVVFILLKTIVPKFKGIYSDIDQELPKIAQNIINISEFIDKYGVVLIFLLFFLSFVMFYFIGRNKKKFEKFILKISLIGKLYKQIKILNFTKSMYYLLNSNISLPEALNLCKNTESELLNEEIKKILKKIEKGEKVQNAFKNFQFFDKEYISFLNIGEKTGDMSISFFNLNEIYYERVNEKIKITLKMLEPISVIIIGILIGFIVYSVMLPIFKMGEML